MGCPVVTLELLYDARDQERVEALATLAGLRQAPITRSVTDAAIWAVRELAARGPAGAPAECLRLIPLRQAACRPPRSQALWT